MRKSSLREEEKMKTKQMNDEKEKYLSELFGLFRRKNAFQAFYKKTQFNATEIRMLNEIITAKYEGKRLISTQIANSLGITRSAVSQIVNRLEEQGIVKRVADETDKKIAYIEITDEALKTYGGEMRKELDFITEVIFEFGEDKFKTMCSLFDEFMEKAEDKKRHDKGYR